MRPTRGYCDCCKKRNKKQQPNSYSHEAGPKTSNHGSNDSRCEARQEKCRLRSDHFGSCCLIGLSGCPRSPFLSLGLASILSRTRVEAPFPFASIVWLKTSSD